MKRIIMCIRIHTRFGHHVRMLLIWIPASSCMPSSPSIYYTSVCIVLLAEEGYRERLEENCYIRFLLIREEREWKTTDGWCLCFLLLLLLIILLLLVLMLIVIILLINWGPKDERNEKEAVLLSYECGPMGG